MFDEVKERIGLVLRKMNLMYRAAVRHFGDRDIWDDGILPEQLHKFKEGPKRDMDGLFAFLGDSTEVIRELGVCTPLRIFRDQYMRFRKSNNLESVKWGEDHYLTTFKSLGLTGTVQRREWRGKTYDGQFINGVDQPEGTGDEGSPQ